MDIFNATFIASINDVTAQQWNTLSGIDYPFLRHEFLGAMEDSGSTVHTTGWQPHHLVVYHSSDQAAKKVVAIMPLFIKYHSYGEYIFDWSWAEAYHRNGLEYYPKLLTAIPFTPATGPRWAIDNNIDSDAVLNMMSEAIVNEAKRLNVSSYHCLFTSKPASQQLTQLHYLPRSSYQYHWFNQDYRDFTGFLATMSSRKRKNIIKEREKITQQNITITMKEGRDITEQQWHEFYQFYQTTYLKRSGQQGYLSPEFFPLLACSMPDNIVMAQAYSDTHNMVAAALFFKDSNTLYGRYWGCSADYDSLHFEACYYQGIDYAIKHKLQRFDPGAQGEHKIKRGFTPIKTYSNHWIARADFKQALEKFVIAEDKEIDSYLSEAKQLLPFKQSD